MQILDRAIGAAKLDVATYEAVEHDSNATLQAALVVIVASLLSSVGVAIALGPSYLILTTVGAVIDWALWATLLWFIGTKLAPEATTEADIGQLLRTLGFAASPGVLRIFVFIPLIGPIVAFLASIWMIVTMVVAARQALDYASTLRAIVVCVAGWLIAALVIWLFFGTAGLGINVPPV
ncbi:hypothetical protein [Salinisphaera orenii]|uniref:hypothetical protein n=1 Tax=Salinisphaera orenii TaxID=856731 RepID=UPI0018C8986B